MKSFLLVAMLSAFLTAAGQKIEMGGKAPGIQFSTCVNKDISKDFFEGKTVVLEFWATWCAPCIAGFPHLNALSKEFSSKDVVFASITQEYDLERVNKLLERMPLDAYNLIDDEGKTNMNYSITSIPRTFVIGKNGTLIWRGYYSELTRELLANLISKQQPILDTGKIIEKIGEEGKVDKPDFKLNVSYSEDQNPIEDGQDGQYLSMSINEGYSWKTETWSFLNFFGLQLNDVNPPRVRCNRADFNIDLEYYCDTSYSRPDEILMKNLANIYNFTYKWNTELSDCWVMKVVDPEKLNEYKNSGNRSSWAKGDDSYIFIAQPLSVVCAQMERFKNEIVILNNTGINERYDIAFSRKNWDDIRKSLEREYGLKLVKAKRPVELLTLSFEKLDENQ